MQVERRSDLSSTCGHMTGVDFSGLEDAPTQILGANIVEHQGKVPAYCSVAGYVAPQIGFEIKLPVSNWNGKYVQLGCGGWCGSISGDGCDDALIKNYACMATDGGHHSADDLKWAYNDIGAIIDYAYRATHVGLLAGRAIVGRFYDSEPSRSYLVGCSGGGRDGLLSAQRFPADFDGIVAGAPAINVTGGVMRLLWGARVIRDQRGTLILSPRDLQTLHTAAINYCDADDGLKDGVIGDPNTCTFDPSMLLCRSGRVQDCLSQKQVDAAKKVYAGPMTSTGAKLYPSGTSFGAEFSVYKAGEWDNDFEHWGSDLFRYMGFYPQPGPGWSMADFNFNRDYERLGMMESLLTATNPDLRKYKERGGRMILYHGWADYLQDGNNTIDYYETVTKTMGGLHETQDFFRLFMLPGVDHCEGGVGADLIDYLSYLDAWVEKGQAPDMMLAVHIKGDVAAEHHADRLFPVDDAKIEFTRPVYPHPKQARYSGFGDPSKAESFRAVVPALSQ